jgi:NAD(P)H-hydrate repair Nnr-like enzyme with NAD(P)H-hydrate epimerase domain
MQMRLVAREGRSNGKRIAVVGRGNNGVDAFVGDRHLVSFNVTSPPRRPRMKGGLS